MKVALLGGSFNPVSNGHLAVAEKVLDKEFVDEVWFVPCGNHAFDKKLIDGQKRIEMLNIAIDGNPKMKVIDSEIKSKDKSYSAKTIKILKEKFPYEFYFVIGSDNLKDLNRWNDFGYLKDGVEFLVVTRPGFEVVNNLEIKMKVAELENTASSTKIREYLTAGKDISSLVPKNVEKYIVMEGLYK